MNIVGEAELFAKKWHGDTPRKYTNEPYWTHPQEVVEILRMGSYDDNMLAAAWLHDVVEDTQCSPQQILAQFGDDVHDLVMWLTHITTPESGNRATRMQIECERLSHAPGRAKSIKLADIIDNTASIVDFDEKFAKVYLEEKRKLIPNLLGGDPKLITVATIVMRQATRSLAWKKLLAT